MDTQLSIKKRDQLGTAGFCRQLEFAIAAHRPGRPRSQQQYNDNYNNKFVISIVIIVMLLYCTPTTPQDFVFGLQQRQQHTC